MQKASKSSRGRPRLLFSCLGLRRRGPNPYWRPRKCKSPLDLGEFLGTPGSGGPEKRRMQGIRARSWGWGAFERLPHVRRREAHIRQRLDRSLVLTARVRRASGVTSCSMGCSPAKRSRPWKRSARQAPRCVS